MKRYLQFSVMAVLLAFGASIGAAQSASYEALTEEAGEAVRAKEYARAIELYRQAREAATRNNQRAQAGYRIGTTHLRAKEYDQGREVFQQLIDDSKTPASVVANAHYEIGNSFVTQRKWAEAEAPLRAAADSPKVAQRTRFNALGSLVTVLESQRKVDDAEKVLEELVEVAEAGSPAQKISALTRKGRFLSFLRQQHAEGRAVFEQAMAVEGEGLAGTKSNTLYQMGLTYAREKNVEKAREIFEQLLADENTTPRVKQSVETQLKRINK